MTDQAYNPADYGGSGDASPVNPFLPSKLQTLGMMLGGLGSGISQAAAYNQPFYMGIAPGVQNFNNTYYGTLAQGLNYDLARKKYELEASYKNMQERMLGLQARQLETNQRLQGVGIAALKRMGIIPDDGGDVTPGIRAPQPPLLGPGSAPTDTNIGNVRPNGGGPNSGFQTVPDFDSGVALAVNNARAYPAAFNGGQPMSISQIAPHWAPKGDGNNDPNAWAFNVSRGSGLDPNQPLDLNNPQTAASFARGVHLAEKGPQAVRPVADYLPGASGTQSPQQPQQMPQQAPAGLPPIPQPPPNAAALGAIGAIPGLQMFGGLAKGQQTDFENRLKYYSASPQAAGAKAQAEATAKNVAHNALMPPISMTNPDDVRSWLEKNNPGALMEADQLGQFKMFPSQLPARGQGNSTGLSRGEKMALTASLYPGWTPVGAAQREDLTNYYGPKGAGADKLASISNSSQHLGEWADAYNELNNGRIPWANKFINRLKTENGWDKEVAVNTVKEAVGTEIAKTIAGTGDSAAAERAEIKDMLAAYHGPAAAAAIAQRLHGMIGARINTEAARAQAAGLNEDAARQFIEGKIGKTAMAAFNSLPTAINQPGGGTQRGDELRKKYGLVGPSANGASAPPPGVNLRQKYGLQ